MTLLPPHPLVVGLAAAEQAPGANDDLALATSHIAAELAAADVEQALLKARGGTAAPAVATPDVTAFGASKERPDYILFAGYLGGGVNPPASQILYLDARLSSWLTVPLKDIALHNRVQDDSAPFRLRDLLWVKAHARVVQGESSESVEQRFLSGPFLRAAEVPTAGMGGGGTYGGGATGLLCEAITPDCCTHKSRL